MRSLPCVPAVLLFVSLVTARADAQPQTWDLLPNVPNPFCGTTTIEFHVPEWAEVYLTVTSPDSSVVIVTLVQGLVDAGYHTVVWDQTDADGTAVPDGVYPYFMSARLPELTGILFEGWQAATVSCAVPTAAESWGRVRSRYRLGDDR